MATMTTRRTARSILWMTVALSMTLAACASNPAPHPTTAPAVSTSLTTTTSTTSRGSHPMITAVDPCRGLTAELVSSIVGFPVVGDGTATDNGSGFVSCLFKAPLDANPTAGATVVVGVQATRGVAHIREELRGMDPTVEPESVSLGDGGYLSAKAGFADLRFVAHGSQFEVNVITPMDRSIDLGALALAVGKRVESGLS